MVDHDLEIHETFNPSTCEIEFLTEKINVESRAKNIPGDAYPFGIFLKYKTNTTTKNSARSSSSLPNIQPVDPSGESEGSSIVGGCNGSIVYGSIYTDQLWMHPQFRGRGLGNGESTRVGKAERVYFCLRGHYGLPRSSKVL